MPQLGRFDYTVQDTSGNAISGASVAIYREGATVNGNQSGTSPLAITVRHAGKIATGDAVFVNAATGTTYTATRTSNTVITLSGFGGTLSLSNSDRLTPSGTQPTLYGDDQGGASTANPLTSSITGRVNAWMEFGAYDFVVSGGGATTTAFTSQIVPSEMPGQIRYADEFVAGSSTGGIQEAINDLPVAGGILVLSGGVTYAPTVATTLVSNLTIHGNGATIQRSASLDALNVFKDAGAALSNVRIRDVVFDNNSRAASAKDIDLFGGATDISIEGCRWINLTNRASDLVRVQTSASKGSRIRITDNRVIGPGAQQTYNSFQVFDCDNVLASQNIIDGFGAIKVEGSLAANLFNWVIGDNVLKSVDQSNILCRIQSASSVSGVVIDGNSITDCGKSGIVFNAVNAADTGLMRDCTISGNSIRGYGVSLADNGISVGGVVTSGTYYCTNVAVVSNDVNGLKSDGTLAATTDRGIQIAAGTRYVSVFANVVRNCGRSGIGIGASDCVVASNTIERAVRRDTSASAPTPTQEGGIATFGNSVYACDNVLIIGNISKNNGVDGTTRSNGITVSRNNTGSSSRHHVFKNRCYDDQGTKTQDYGIAIGSVAGVSAANSLIIGNDCVGNQTAGILGPQGTSTGIFLRDNVPNDGVTQNITAAATAILASADRVLLTADASYTLTAAPTIADGFYNGQEIEIMTVDTVDTITLQDQGTLASSNLRLSAATIALAPRDNIRLRYDTTIADWVQIGQVNVL